MALVEMEEIRKDYLMGETVVPALRGVDFTVEREGFVAIWGPSGSGKTTLLNLIGGIDAPSSGRLTLMGHDLAGLSDNQRTELRNRFVGFIFQRFNLVAVLSALENVMLPLQIRAERSRDIRARAMACLAGVGLGDFAAHRPDKLSGGQQQRVAIARALVTRPAMVIADEPTANLDTDTSMQIIDLMRELNGTEKTTFLFSTHDQRLLDRVDRLVRLEDGRIVDGGPKE